MDELEKYLEEVGTPIKKEADQTAYEYYDEDGNYIGSGYVKKGDTDPVGQRVYKLSNGNYGVLPDDLVESVRITTDNYTPTIKVDTGNNKLVLSGTKNALESSMASELREYLNESLKYQELASENTAKIINEINEDLRSQVERSVVEGGLGADYDTYKDYAHAKEVMSATNPLKKTGEKNKIAGYDKGGKKVYKTPQEWLDYYREQYTTDERIGLFNGAIAIMSDPESDAALDFALYTPYLVMSGGRGGDTPIYGFDALENARAFGLSFMNEASAKLIESGARGATRLASFVLDADGYRRRANLNGIAHSFGLNDVTSDQVKWLSEDQFNQKIQSLIGKTRDELSDDDKRFIVTAISDSIVDGLLPTGQRFAERFVFNDDGVIDENFLAGATYENYTNARDNLSTIEKYDKEMDKADEAISTPRSRLQQLVENAASYAPFATGAGSFLGTLARFEAERFAISGLTGGAIDLGQIGDKTLDSFVRLAGKASGVVPGAATVSTLVRTPVFHFLAAVAAEIPEDIIQTAVDDTLTGNNPLGNINAENVLDNTLFNLGVRLAFTPVSALAKTIRSRNAIKAAQQATGLSETVNIDPIINANREVKRAADNGNIAGVTEDGKIKIYDENGMEKVLDNTHVLAFENMSDEPVLQNLAHRFRRNDDLEVSFEAVSRAKKAVENGDYISDVNVRIIPASEYDFYTDIIPRFIPDNYIYDSIIESKLPVELQQAWYIGDGVDYDTSAKQRMFNTAANDPALRNAALNKMFNEWKIENPGNSNLKYEDWLNTEITLYRGRPKGSTGDDGSGVLSYTLKKSVAEKHGDVVDELRIRPIETTGILKSDWLADGIESEAEIFVPYTRAVDRVSLEPVPKGKETLYRGQPYSQSESFVYNSPQFVGNTDFSPKNSFGDAFFFTTYKPWAMEFGDSLVSWDVDRSKMLSFDDYWSLRRTAEELVASPDKMAQYVLVNGPEKGDLMRRVADNDFRAAAELSGKPVIMATEGKVGPEWLYFKGVDEDFDRHAYTQLLASTTPNTPDADAANISMANQLQQAIETQPYNKTPAEIIADKYTQAGPISDAPNSASPEWNAPTIDGSYPDIRHAMADQPTNLNMPEVKNWFYKTKNTFNRIFRNRIVPVFNERYPTDTDKKTFVRNMHYLFHLQKMGGIDLEHAVGRTFIDQDGMELKIKQEDIDFYKEYLNPMMQELREFSVAGLKLDPETATKNAFVGYLPHTTYSPMDMGAEEALQQGNLWKTYSGKNALTVDGNFTTTTLIDDLDKEMQIFADNMIWDSLGERAIAAKVLEELNVDGIETSSANVDEMIKKTKAISDATSKATSVKKITKALSSNSDVDFSELQKQIDAEGEKAGATKAIQNAYRPIYGEAGAGAYHAPSNARINVMQTSDIMRNISTPDGSLYDYGGRMVVAGDADAKYLASRFFEMFDNPTPSTAKEIRQMFVDYLSQGGRRTSKGAEYVAQQWMDKIAKHADETGAISKRDLVATMKNLIYFEGSSRLKRWVARADLSRFNSGTTKFLDNFLYRQGVLSHTINNSSLIANINKGINGIISARMKSLFWLNFKNAVLQSSECVRLFTEFKLGDSLATIKRLSTDKEFRDLVSEWVDILVPDGDFSKSADAIDIAADIADKTRKVGGDIEVSKLTASEQRSLFKKMDELAMTPVDMGENLKNYTLVAGILQEAQRKGLTGDQLFNYVNKKFERIGLANNAMGRLGGSDNPLFRIATNLKTFSIREVGMWLNNIKDMNGGEAIGYLIKNLGWKIGLATALSKLGYSVPQSLGVDPFGIMDDEYTGIDEEDYNALDNIVAGPAGKVLLSGGFTSYLADVYWASRQAYERDLAVEDTAARELEDKKFFELAPPYSASDLSFDNIMGAAGGFIPGYTQGKRTIDMGELMASGWATSATGNLMYAAPDTPLDAAGGFVFGRGTTDNARTYYQTADPLQGLIENGPTGFAQQFFGRGFGLRPGGFRSFDPVDTQNYSDWFYGDSRDDQQWNLGYYYFRDRARQIQDTYQNSLQDSYDEDDKSSLYNEYNAQLRELDDQISRFVQAYREKNGGKFDANKMNNILTVMRTYQPDLNADELSRNEAFFDANDAALQRYTAAGLPQQVSYTYSDEDGTEVEYSPQVRAALQGRYGLPEEASRLIQKVYNDKWKDLNKDYREKYYNSKNSKEKKAIQEDYFNLVRADLDPIVALYGAEIFSNDTVGDIMEDVFNSMMPYGQTTKKYLQEKYKNYMPGSIAYSQPRSETLDEIRANLDAGKTARAKALARALLQRVQENRQVLTREEMEYLQGVLK